MKSIVMKKSVCILLIFVLVLSMLIGCANTAPKDNSKSNAADSNNVDNAKDKDPTSFVHDSNLNEPGTKPICKEKVTLVLGVPQNASVEDWDTNFQTTMLEKDLNYDLEFRVYPSGEFTTQINLAVAAGGEGLPDIILSNFNLGDDVVYSWAQAGAIIPLTEYYENSSYYLKEAVERTGVDFIPMITSPDGNIYYVPAYNQSLTNEYPAKIWMYEPWLDKLGLKEPTTPEEFRAVLRAFKEQDPNGNNKADEIPLISTSYDNYYWFEALMAPFQFLYGDAQSTEAWFDVTDGVVSAAYATDGYREGLKYIRSLFDEGLIDPLSFTNDSSQTKALLAQEETVIGTYITMAMSDLPATDKRRTLYKGIAPLKSADGKQYTPYMESIPYPAGLVTSNCDYPEAAFRFLDYLVSEEVSIHTRWGEKGVDWLEPVEGEKSMYDALGYKPVLKSVLPWGQPQNKHWQQTGPFIRQYSIALGVVWDGNELQTGIHAARIQGEYTNKHPKEYIPKLIYTPEEQDVVSGIIPTLDTYVKESIAKFCTNYSGMDIYDDAAWNNYKKQLEIIGLPEVLEVVQSVYDRMYK